MSTVDRMEPTTHDIEEPAMNMDMWKYFGITHTDHTVMNPMSLPKTRELVDQLHQDGSSLDRIVIQVGRQRLVLQDALNRPACLR